MIERLRNSWELVKASGRVLQADTELLLFPVFSGIAMILVTVTFIVPLAIGGIATSKGGGPAVGAYIVFLAFYFIQYSVIIFFNSALVGAAQIRLRGGDPTVSDGINIALRNLTSILGYAAIAATVGLILKIVRDKAGFVGKILAAIGGIAWSLATYLVVPVLVARGVGPIEAIKQSASILKRTWGEQIAGSVGIGLVFGFGTLIYSLIAIPLVVVSAVSGAPVAVTIGLAGVVVLGYILLAVVSSALKGVYSAALYEFATTGEASMFDRTLLASAFQTKR
ncbi:MAG: DUF6159 family protein [Acidobacteriota bacterium]